jgi:hypothetical protein
VTLGADSADNGSRRRAERGRDGKGTHLPTSMLVQLLQQFVDWLLGLGI